VKRESGGGGLERVASRRFCVTPTARGGEVMGEFEVMWRGVAQIGQVGPVGHVGLMGRGSGKLEYRISKSETISKSKSSNVQNVGGCYAAGEKIEKLCMNLGRGVCSTGPLGPWRG